MQPHFTRVRTSSIKISREAISWKGFQYATKLMHIRYYVGPVLIFLFKSAVFCWRKCLYLVHSRLFFISIKFRTVGFINKEKGKKFAESAIARHIDQFIFGLTKSVSNSLT